MIAGVESAVAAHRETSRLVRGQGDVLNDDIFKLRISTEAFDEKDRLEAFRENFGKAILRVEMEPAAEIFEADMQLLGLPHFGMASGFVSPVANKRAADLIDNDDLVFVFMESGQGSLQADGHTIAVSAGDAVLTANDKVAVFAGETRTSLVNLRFNREKLALSLCGDVASLAGHKLRNGVALRLLKHYAAAIESEASAATAETRKLMVDHLYDLAALALGANRDVGVTATQRGLRAARLRAIKTTILDNLADRTLSALTVGNRQGIGQRYVQLLFEAEGTTFSEFLLTQRLKRAHRLLNDPAHAGRSVSAIAYDVGFNDLSYFNRTFRRAFGATPSDIRRVKKPD